MHPNLLAYESYEQFSSTEAENEYKKKKLAGVNCQTDFVCQKLDKVLKVLEIGSGNSKFLFSLQKRGALDVGYGVEISESRIDFANQWKEELEIDNVHNVYSNILDMDISILPKFDLIYCVDLAFQFIDPLSSGSDSILLSRLYDQLAPGGSIILELDTHKRIQEKMIDGELKTWQEFPQHDPWKYALWDCSEDGDAVKISKTFIKRDMSETSESEVILKNYSRDDMMSLLKDAGFSSIDIFEEWSADSSTLDDEFIIMGYRKE